MVSVIIVCIYPQRWSVDLTPPAKEACILNVSARADGSNNNKVIRCLHLHWQ